MKNGSKFLLTSLVVALGTTVLAEKNIGDNPATKVIKSDCIEQNFEDSLKNLKISLTKEEQKVFNFRQKIVDCKKKSEQGDYRAMLELANYYTTGIIESQDYNKAIELLDTIIDESKDKVLKGKALNKLGYMMMEGRGFRRSNEEAANYAKRALKLGNVDAYGLLFRSCNYRSNKNNRDDKKALDFLKKGIKVNSPESFLYLAAAYKTGQMGLKKDLKKSFEYYKKAADLDNPEALFIVGWSVFDGDYIDKKIIKQENFATAFNYIKRAIELDPCQITKLLQFARKLDKKEKIKIINFLMQLVKIENKNLIALKTLENFYKSDYVKMKNIKKAVSIVEYGLKHNPKNIELHKQLARSYGSGVTFRSNNGSISYGSKTEFTNAKKAFEIYKKLADNYNICNVDVAQYLLYNVDGVMRNDEKGFYYLQRSLEEYEESDHKMINLINSLFRARHYGITMNFGNFHSSTSSSNDLYSKKTKELATELINHEGQNFRIVGYKLLAKMYYNGYGVEKNYNKFIEYVKQGQTEGDREAYIVLSYCYLNGIAVKKDSTKVCDYIIKYIEKEKWNDWRVKQLIKLISETDSSISPKIFEKIKKLAAQNNKIAIKLESYCYQHGYGVKKDFKRAQKFLISSLDKTTNTNQRSYIMQSIIENYKSNSSTKKEFFTWSKKGYEYKDSQNYNRENYATDLIKCYLVGYGTKVNVSKALDLLDGLLKKNKRMPYNIDARSIAMIYALGLKGQKQNLPKAIELMEAYCKTRGNDNSFYSSSNDAKILLELLKEKLAEQNSKKK